MPLFTTKHKPSAPSTPAPTGKNLTPQTSNASLKFEETRAEGLEAEKKSLANKGTLKFGICFKYFERSFRLDGSRRWTMARFYGTWRIQNYLYRELYWRVLFVFLIF